MSSHREAPEISKDPVADSTDLYAFVSPDQPDTVTLISNYIPETAASGPNFYEFGDDVLYEIHIDNNGDAVADITYQFAFKTTVANPDTFLYNTGPIESLDSKNWNRKQSYTVTRVAGGNSTTLGSDLACPPCNVGPRSTPKYADLAQAAVHKLDGATVFAGQRRDPFYVDLGAVFDLGDLRPFQNLHLIPSAAQDGVDTQADKSVHTIAIQVPKTQLTSDGSDPKDPMAAASVIGVWCTASRQKMQMMSGATPTADANLGPWVQVSRLGQPLINEVVIPMGQKDFWNSTEPKDDQQFLKYVQHPELAGLLPVLYPKVFPNLAAYTAERADLAAILMTGIPEGIVPGFQNFTGKTPADMLRLNMAIAPAAKPNRAGLVGGDAAGYPNGRRVFDDVLTIELRAIAGVTIPLVDKNFKPDGAAALVSDNLKTSSARYRSAFPYIGTPLDGYSHPNEQGR